MDSCRWSRENTERGPSSDKCGLLLNVSAYSGIIHFQRRKVRSQENIDKDLFLSQNNVSFLIFNNSP